ncbi:hypothetical protein P5P86_03745 [Nocardioides sp. BP30]|uniref:hypothetical protein n=1 Tax=Nocardioides sp. BP30 TaxID=3036374 RepID=UPI0024690B24|nr:hypothetical protein [Nocardioides sp. BP30]WGL52943.1 hypothetical protein P5P86_03745 [Nocardioides sp. BP30]
MSKSRSSDVPLTGIAIGAVVLALVVVFAVLLPKAQGDEADTSRIALPSSLPGGYKAADNASAWKGNANVAGNEAQVAAQVKAEIAFGNAALKKTTGGGFGNRIYIKGASEIYFVQAFRAAGGAFSPGELSDPSKLQQGTSVQQLIKTGDATCIVDGTTGTGGQVTPSETQCQVSKGDLTIQVMAPSVAASDVAKVADLVLTKVD